MRLLCSIDNPDEQKEVAEFSKWILDVGEGKIPCTKKDGEDEASWITVPHDLLLFPAEDRPCLDANFFPKFYYAKRRFPITSKCWHMYRVLNVDEIKN
jgi:hypothetical protein